jgi:sugar/nucleoside kinase (ribokinase family)
MSGAILVVGDVVTDIVAVHNGPLAAGSDTTARISITSGGSAANTAAWLAYAGAAVHFLGVVGVDAAGEERVAELADAGVGTSCVEWTRSAPTGSVIVLADGSDRTMISDRGANLELQPSHVDDALARLLDVRHVHLSGYTLLDARSRAAGLRALAAASERGLSTSVDAASAAPLRRVGADSFLRWVDGVQLLLANLDEARVLSTMDDAAAQSPLALAEAFTRGRRGVGPHEAVVKLGPDGAVWIGADRIAAAPAIPVTPVDATGAGDAFAAGLLAARLAGMAVDAALAAAVRLGAQAVGMIGGRPPGSAG